MWGQREVRVGWVLACAYIDAPGNRQCLMLVEFLGCGCLGQLVERGKPAQTVAVACRSGCGLYCNGNGSDVVACMVLVDLLILLLAPGDRLVVVC
jgi:hypothetical protein